MKFSNEAQDNNLDFRTDRYFRQISPIIKLTLFIYKYYFKISARIMRAQILENKLQ